LLQESKSAIDIKGPNAIEMGDRTGGEISAPGRAILASQQSGMIQIDNLRHLGKRVFRSLWARVRQYWTAEKWLRVTDDDRNVKWLGLNLDPFAMAQFEMRARAHPDEARANFAGVMGSMAELDCDIVIDDAPDSLTPQLEQFQSLVELKKYDAAGEIPFRAMPNLKDKQAFLKDMDEQAARNAQAAQGMQALRLRGAAAEVVEKEGRATLDLAKAKNVMLR
jgi:hypothetical protein